MLDSHGVIFVGAQDSGNSSYDMSRRMPLAVIAALNVLHQSKVDPERIFVGGMSGGSGGTSVCPHRQLAICGQPEPATFWLSLGSTWQL